MDEFVGPPLSPFSSLALLITPGVKKELLLGLDGREKLETEAPRRKRQVREAGHRSRERREASAAADKSRKGR